MLWCAEGILGCEPRQPRFRYIEDFRYAEVVHSCELYFSLFWYTEDIQYAEMPYFSPIVNMINEWFVLGL